jgi:hypothetical protein
MPVPCGTRSYHRLNKRFRRALAFFPVVALALMLTLLYGGGDRARAMLQTSLLQSPIEPVATLTLPPPDIGQPPSQVFPTLEPPTEVPLPATVGPTPTALGFLPAPTIVNPNDLKSLPLAQPPASGSSPTIGDSPAGPASGPTPQDADSSLRAAVALLNYAWLVCGGLLLIGGAVAIILLWRRGQQA